MQKPDWWDWPFECERPHVLRRMRDRSFNEVDLRDMLESAKYCKPDAYLGRFVISVEYEGTLWEIIVEPNMVTRTVIVITAFKVKVRS